MLHSMDQWFINPYTYKDHRSDGFEIAALNTELTEYPEKSKFTKLELILGQFRHIMFHIGMIYGCILMERGEIPNYAGLADPIKPG